MAKLYIANCTKQRHEFVYRVPEQKIPLVKVIEIGSQELIWRDASPSDLEYIISQHQRYGLVAASEIDRAKHFVGMCYSIDKPVDVRKIMYTVESNDAVLEERALATRKQSAEVASHTLSLTAQQSGNSLNSLEVEVVELQRPGIEPKVQETITVKQNGRRGRRAREGA